MFGYGFVAVLGIFCSVLCCGRTANIDSNRNPDQHLLRHSTNGKVSCDTDDLEYRLTKLEVKVEEKSNHVLGELREGNRKLQTMEYQNVDVLERLEALKSGLDQFSDIPPRIQRSSAQTGPNRSYQVEVMFFAFFEALQKMYGEISSIRRNLTELVNITSSIRDLYEDLPTKEFLMANLEKYQPIPPDLFKTPPKDTPTQVPKNCRDLQERGETQLGIFTIQPPSSQESFLVVCDMDTRGGGWTYIHNRFEGLQDFHLSWDEYKRGFGNLAGEFWLGLDHIHELTGNEVNELLVELVDVEGKRTYAHYSAFSVGTEQEGYSMKILGGYQGDAGDSLTYHAGARFSTKDKDQDSWDEGNCAQAHSGAWWYKGCDRSNLNGKYFPGELPETLLYHGMYWDGFGGPKVGLAQARMMIRPRGPESPPIFVKNSDLPSIN